MKLFTAIYVHFTGVGAGKLFEIQRIAVCFACWMHIHSSRFKVIFPDFLCYILLLWCILLTYTIGFNDKHRKISHENIIIRKVNNYHGPLHILYVCYMRKILLLLLGILVLNKHTRCNKNNMVEGRHKFFFYP